MDCHRCIHVRYDGCSYGRCSHPNHKDVRLRLEKKGGGERPYNKDVCPDFQLRRKCSNCKHWIRGRYFADGQTAAQKGHCGYNLQEKGDKCSMWKQGPTSWKKRPVNQSNEGKRK